MEKQEMKFTKFQKIKCGKYEYFFISYHETLENYCYISTEESDDQEHWYTVKLSDVESI